MAYDEDLAERIRLALEGEPGISEKAMFGGLAFLKDGHLTVAASAQGGMLVRCRPGETDQHIAAPGVARMEMRGREMGGWLRVDAAALESNGSVEHWVEVGLEYARTLPPK